MLPEEDAARPQQTPLRRQGARRPGALDHAADAQRARRARRELLLIVPLIAVTIVAYLMREQIFGVDTPVRVAAAVVLVVLGWALARDLGRCGRAGAVPAHGPRRRRARSAS